MIETLVHIDPDRDQTIIERTERFDGLLDLTAALRNEGIHGSSEMRHVAEIPGVIIESYCNTNGITFQEFMADPKHIKSICNDPDLSYFRIAPGRV
ncbi:hypothetical protein [Burkholderia cenocepacia]|uniref:hypothetical protein n=1 Tax=Burkholderia cenocepacia TaxID=95486 RepID=UPI002230370F|nr:hypothetical protein [Burkholderia cenocepacia]MCW3539330.1 hypothetical protein [Burkholderia cenocepacia]